MSDSIVESRVTLTDEGYIELDDETIGYLGWNENVLVDMIIDEPHRGNGIGTVAIEKMVDKMLTEDPSIEKITTTTVLSGAMGSALKKVGFNELVVEEPIMDPDNAPDGVSADQIPVEDHTEYVYTVG